MHEATVANAILKRALHSAGKENRAESYLKTENSDGSTISAQADMPFDFLILRIIVEIGEFRNVDPESLEFAFSALRKDFAATRNTVLEIRSVEAKARCARCEHLFHPSPSDYFACTKCGGSIEKFLSGEELDIVSIEVEERHSIAI